MFQPTEDPQMADVKQMVVVLWFQPKSHLRAAEN